jgi:hypothetical protein
LCLQLIRRLGISSCHALLNLLLQLSFFLYGLLGVCLNLLTLLLHLLPVGINLLSWSRSRAG